MRKMLPWMMRFIPILVLLTSLRAVDHFASQGAAAAGRAGESKKQEALLAASNEPIFRYPVVRGATISGYFDHNAESGVMTFYDGRRSSPGAGFYFQCSSPWMYDWVGCESGASGEPGCPNNRELWYDNHRGTDYEFSSRWHTGATCDPGRFTGITANIYAPAGGRVFMAGYDANRPGNGWHIRLQHDLNGNGNFADDNFRSIYLHFTANALAVTAGQIVSEGQYLGLGGSTGYSSSPHLHFEIQRSSDYFQYSYWSVDPYGWSGGNSADPWPYENITMWKMPNRILLPGFVNNPGCASCGELLENNGFEDGLSSWVEETEDIIVDTSYPSLPITPYEGSWLAWLGGRNDANDVLYQDFAVPAGLSRAQLRYRLYISTDESGEARDYLYVRVRTTDGTVIEEVEQFDSAFSKKGQWVERSLNLASLPGRGGQTLRLQFKATTDGSQLSNFFIDQVSITAQE